jgi:hypothetical protein
MGVPKMRIYNIGTTMAFGGIALVAYAGYKLQCFCSDPSFSAADSLGRNLSIVWCHGKQLWFTKSDLANWNLQWLFLWVGAVLTIGGGSLRYKYDQKES